MLQDVAVSVNDTCLVGTESCQMKMLKNVGGGGGGRYITCVYSTHVHIGTYM